MKYFFLFLISLIASVSWSQQTEQVYFAYDSAKLSQVLSEVESAFDIKYSYVDSIVAPKHFTLEKKKYTLPEINVAISQQTGLVIVKIDDRYYSLFDNSLMIVVEPLREIIVEGFLSKGINKTAQKVVISPQQVEALPGVTDADILLSLQQLPGVKSPNETASGLHIRGGTSDENLILWDGIRLYHPGHLFGMISGFNPNVVRKVNYYNKATAAKFGERVSSVIDIRTSDEIPEKVSANAGLNALNADVEVQLPLVKNKLGLELAARKSYTEWWQSPTFDALAKKVFQNSSFEDFSSSNRFNFEDYSGKLNYKPSKGTSISFTGILINNYLNFNTQVPGEGSKNQKMDIFNQGYGLNWKQQYNSKLHHHLLLYYATYTFDYDKRQDYTLGRFEAFSKQNRVVDSGMEMNFDYRFSPKLNLEMGYQMIGNDLSHALQLKNQGFEITLDQRQHFNVTHSGFAEAEYNLRQWDFRGGLRYNYFNSLQTNNLEPRIFIQRKLSKNLLWQLSYEKKSQILSQIRESGTNEQSLENYVWLLADKTQYPIQKAQQYSTGLIFKTKSWLVDTDAYYKTTDGLTSLAFGSLYRYDTAIRKGNGFTKGIDVLVQKSAPNWRAWLTYTFQDSKNRYDGLNNEAYFASNSSISHALNIAFYKKWNRFSVSLGWFWHTGKPYSVLAENGQVVSLNKERLPNYHRLDVSGIYQFRVKKSWSGKLGVSVLNIYNQSTVISKEYERQTTNLNDINNFKYNVLNFHSLGITPNIFIRVSI